MSVFTELHHEPYFILLQFGLALQGASCYKLERTRTDLHNQFANYPGLCCVQVFSIVIVYFFYKRSNELPQMSTVKFKKGKRRPNKDLCSFVV